MIGMVPGYAVDELLQRCRVCKCWVSFLADDKPACSDTCGERLRLQQKRAHRGAEWRVLPPRKGRTKGVTARQKLQNERLEAREKRKEVAAALTEKREALGRMFRRARGEESALSLSLRSGVPYARIVGAEKGTRNTSLRNLAKMASALGMEMQLVSEKRGAEA